jgi:hypothetical protein
MQTFHNATHEPLEFEVRHARYHVPVGANVVIEEELVWVVKARGLRLTHGPAAAEHAPTVKPERIAPHRPPLPRGVELGPIKRRAREENEDPEVGDGPVLAGDDDGAETEEDPIAKAAKQLEAQGINLDGLAGGRPGRRRKV